MVSILLYYQNFEYVFVEKDIIQNESSHNVHVPVALKC